MIQRAYKMRFSEIAVQIKDACDWLESLGVNASGTRIGKYRRMCLALANGSLFGHQIVLRKSSETDEFVNLFYETLQFLRISEQLKTLQNSDLIERLKHAVRGCYDYVNEREPRAGRDFAFELSMGAHLLDAGYEPSFQGPADLSTVVTGESIVFECKRVKSARQIPRLVADALTQLSTRFKSDPSLWGVVAIAIDKCVNPTLQLIDGAALEELGTRSRVLVNDFINKHRRHWQRDAIDARTIGVMIVHDAPAIDLSTHSVVVLRQTGVDRLQANSRAGQPLLTLISTSAFNVHQC